MRDLPEGDALSLPKGWVETTLGEVADIIDGDRGKNYPNGQDFSTDGYCLFLNTKNTPNTTFSFSEKMFITKEKDGNLRKGKLKRGDFVLTTRGTIGNYAYFSDDIPYDNIRINSGMVLLRTNVVKGFFYYYLGSNLFKHQVVSLQSGSAQPQLPIKDLKMFEVNLPPLPEQKSIADMLSSFDEKIELLREQNKTLETLAQTIFKEWFVNFNYPDLSACGHAQADATGEMVASELGEIPKGWRVGIIGDLFELHRGFDLPKKDRKEGAYPVYAAGGYHGQHKEYKMEPPGIITGRSGVIGKVYLSLTKYWPLNTTLYVRNFKACGPYYTYFFLNMFDLESINSGSAVPSLNRNNVHNIPTLIADSNLLERFENITKEIFAKIKFNDSQVETLSKTRDTLLPQLMSGQVRVKA